MTTVSSYDSSILTDLIFRRNHERRAVSSFSMIVGTVIQVDQTGEEAEIEQHVSKLKFDTTIASTPT